MIHILSIIKYFKETHKGTNELKWVSCSLEKYLSKPQCHTSQK